MPSRRSFLQATSLAPFLSLTANEPPATIIKPSRLKPGDTIGLFCPAAPAYSQETVKIAQESLAALGFQTKLGPHIYDRYGYLAGRDADRVSDLHAFFDDKSVKAVMAIHGGWGCARLLPLLDYNLIQRNPKILIGYSDVTALLLAIYAKTGLVTMHGPVGSATFNAYTVNWLKQVLIEGEAVTMRNPTEKGDNLTQVQDRITTIKPGLARGRLVGGNLTVLSHLIGSSYLPDWKNTILFVEDTHEDVYRMDRMLTHLKLAGILDQISGFVFGKCSECGPGSGGYGSLTLDDVLTEHIIPLNKPAFSGAMIGHIRDKFTVPLGIDTEIDATAGTIRLLESAVS
ncbi:S66 peptidase family protein [Spirosoma foliorum]|uniref:LD-carboxypeptidase n=1 Tax=Spirosoma foliorum TaxID=2710596 RepID=A0A7G5GPH1_9BACT|nr:LD-carboxypeptidase [Spirosoma foliorum]QMW00763.1 LD-carboxypeptidase [Spirosoma foliorum]